MAKRGAQPGNTNAEKRGWFDEAMRIAAAQDDRRRLRLIAEKALEQAATGDMEAIRFVAERLDGKPKQPVEHSTDPEAGFVIQHSLVGDLIGSLAGVSAQVAPLGGDAAEPTSAA